jgi:hypothetical protein
MNLLSVEVLITIILIVIGIYYYTGSVVAVFLVFLLLCGAAYFLGAWVGLPLSFPIQFVYDTEISPEPTGSLGGFDSLWNPFPVNIPEVFHIAGNKYTYADAPNVCAAYDSQLASYDQVLEAHGNGAEWCEYGWSQGGMALFPTQESTWTALQGEDDSGKRKSCGRPGVNGGYFDQNTQFGVNCYGVKPGCNNKKYPIPMGQSDKDQAAISKFKADQSHIKVWPFSRNGWSAWGMCADKNYRRNIND